jgi:Predicted unsaturated glucuronyl hydrolase involved in regulation of bacterial surface properties, and related proteins
MKRQLTTLKVLLLSINLMAQTLPSKSDIISSMKLVNNYWINQNTTPGNNQWARAVYFTGNMDFYKIYSKNTYLDYVNLWANNNNWALNGGSSTRSADNQIAGQTYIDLYNLDSIKQNSKIKAIKTSVDNMVNSTIINDWWWIDALNMAMPVFTRLGSIYNDNSYYNKMYALYCYTKDTISLYNSNKGLWYRDASYMPPYKTTNGFDSFWARGNGWVLSAHARVLQMLPLSEPHRAEYIETFKNMAAAIKDRQRSDGFWNVSLDDPNEYGGPETSGTALFTYGIAWGINNNLLDSATYYPIVTKAWNALTSVAVQTNGFLGYVQGVGSSPASSQPVTVSSTADFGVGAFLLAGSEVVKLATGEMPAPSSFTLLSVIATDQNHIKVKFNNKIDSNTSLVASNYTVNNGVTVPSVAKANNDSCCILSVSGMTPGSYNLSIQNVKSVDGYTIESRESKAFIYSGIAAVTASGYQSGTSNTPDKTLDFDFNTRWSCDGKGQWIMYDLGNTKLVTSVDIALYSGNTRVSYFTISLSTDSINFTDVYSGQSSGTSTALENFDFTGQIARYVKITGYGNSQSTWNSYTEVRINNGTTAAVNELKNEPDRLSLYPNPLIGHELTICLPNNVIGKVTALITDLTGKCILSKTITTDGNKFILSGLNLLPGQYLVSLKTNETIQNGSLIVK